MKLIDLIGQCHQSEVFDIMNNYYQTHKIYISAENFEKLYKSLFECELKETSMVLYVKYESPTHYMSDDNIHHVYGIDTTDNKSYGLDFTSWGEWLNIPIADETIDSYEKEELVAHIIWEITAWGWSEESMAKRKSELLESMKEVELGNGIDATQLMKDIEDFLEKK